MIALWFIIWFVPDFLAVAIPIALIGFFLGPVFPSAIMVCTTMLPRHLHLSAIGFSQSLGGGGGQMWPFAIGAVAQRTGIVVLPPFCIALTAGALVVWLMLPRVAVMRVLWEAKGMKIMGGIYDINNVGPETQQFIDAAHNNWDAVDTVVIGNEAVSDGMATVPQVVAAVNQARSMLRAAGYNGKVVTVDTSQQVIDNPALCQASDYAAANCHAFFNAGMTPDGAGSWVNDQAQRVSDACGGKPAMIMESGWPSQGETNGLAVPSQANQQAAIASLRSAFSENIVLFSAFNDYWKRNTPSTFDAEQYWGIYGNAPS